ncbi:MULTISPECIES: ParB/RepB/Spo0J family partition protein [unclassified Methylophilus]|jgi:ParB family chromosome partitioning protein|uniref:ParB/RepB/Spo0J family partition protein n=1 Tax=Methylophilus glucosoxydans TaxID=752553 RepID=A0ABW3GFB4_9PROT|nr:MULTISPECIES: ParB/RepB/Spo0J family partition protein [unclassified Methylophilus]MBF5040580.1 ParB/RepB/Spo0J family partition protein [Methylophilus sp. 13]MDF0379044.1 ParB/RepB/Spo0J family partition protein [Methylophilus sp. YYY-1]MDT7848607.1 ParB/RepB/Spo0J family partition protein [Methylophilus sp. VKM B-3414]BEV09495.1 ParB/RepB/Spo0J family partition protein [Methylophilus sp. DW102]
MVKPKGLGRGLDALLSGDAETIAQSDMLRTLPVGQLQPGKYQPRSYMNEEALQTLADSIAAQGIMQPILVREIAPEKFEIIAGERRWRASQKAGLTEVPVLVREIADEAALAMALIENIQRENLNPLEEAMGIKRLIDEFEMTHEKAAQAVGRSRVAVSNLLRLLTLTPMVQDMLLDNQIDMGHARALVGIEPAQQILLANKVVQDGLSVREVERMIQSEPASGKKAKPAVHPDVATLQNQLSEQLGAEVSISSKANGAGVLKLSFANLDQLDDWIAKLTDNHLKS